MVSNNENISNVFGGGSFESIVALWPFLIFAGYILLDESKRKTYENNIRNKNIDIESLLLLSIWFISFEEWTSSKYEYIDTLIKIGTKNEEDFQDRFQQAIHS